MATALDQLLSIQLVGTPKPPVAADPPPQPWPYRIDGVFDRVEPTVVA